MNSLQPYFRKILTAILLLISACYLYAQPGGNGTITGSASVCIGSTVTYSCKFNSPPFSWDVSGGTIQGSSTNSSVSVHWPSAAGSGTVTVFYDGGSGSLNVTVSGTPVAGTISGPSTVCSGGSGTINASAGSIIRWEKSTNGGSSWTTISNTSSSYTFSGLTQTTQFRAVRSSTCGTANSPAQTVSVFSAPSAGSIGSDQTICANTAPALLTNVGSASGGSGSLVYQWETRPSGGTWVAVSGATSTTYQPGSLTQTTEYRRRVTDGCSVASFSNSAIITVNPFPIIVSMTGGGNYCQEGGGITAGLTNSEVGVTYQLRLSGATVQTVSGTGSSVTWASGLTAAGTYTAVASRGSCTTNMSGNVVVQSYSLLTAGAITGAATLCYNAVPSVVGNAPASGGSGSYQYQWERRIPNGTWAAIAGATTANYQEGALTQSYEYRRKVTDSNCGSTKYSNTVVITITPLSIGGAVSGSQDFFTSGSGSLVLSGNTGTIQNWQSRTASGAWTTIVGTTSTLAYSALTQTTEFRAVIQNGACGVAYSSSSFITIYPLPFITIQGPSVLSNQEPTTLSASGYYAYQWQKDGTDISGATASAYPVTATGNYSVRVQSSAGGPFITSGITHIATWLEETLPLNTTFTIAYQRSGVTASTTLDQLLPDDYRLARSFIDGIGRPVQVVQYRSTPLQNDMVQPVAYDRLGRAAKQYLPYASSAMNGSYRSNAISDDAYTQSEQYLFYQNTAHVAADGKPYRAVSFETSPVNNVIEQGSIGSGFQPGEHSAKAYMRTNIASDNVLLWTFAGTLPASNQYYAAGSLMVSQTIDAAGLTTQIFTDKAGKTILQRIIGTDGASVLETYYVYDDFDRPVIVFSPEGVKTMISTSNYSPNATFLDAWAYQYRYDSRHRVVEQKVPGSDWQYIVYDRWNRVVLMQDGNRRQAGEWMFIKYDAFNRPVMTGIYATTETRGALQVDVETFYSDPSLKYEVRDASGYTQNSFPAGVAESSLLKINYYDDYTFLDYTGWADQKPSFLYTDEGLGNVQAFDQTNGLPTGGKVRILNESMWLRSVAYYDNRQRTIQSVSDNHLGGMDRGSVQYDFIGKTLKTKATHTNSSLTRTIQQRVVYDPVGRILQRWHQVDNDTEILLTHYAYNELGQLIEKNLHSEDNGATYKQSLDYTYDIRGALLAINNADLVSDVNNDDTNEAKDLFGFDLAYDKAWADVNNTPLYDGMISAMKWSVNQGFSDEKAKAYAYAYDPFKRLQAAQSYSKTSAWAFTTDGKLSGLTYDANGNILTLARMDKNGTIDQLTYDYGTGTARSNRLLGVSDTGTAKGFNDGNTGSADFLYDVNGNMIKDLNKSIASIAYNLLNQPAVVTQADSSSIHYRYTASGQKLTATRYDASNNPLKKTDYAGGYLYENDTLKFIQHAEGRIIPAPGGNEYQYNFTDHLGNVRLTFTAKQETETNEATLEATNQSDERSEFLRYDNVRLVNSNLFDHTNDATNGSGNALRLSGGANEKDGLARSLSVMAGDVINMQVYAKYVDPAADPNNFTPVLQTLLAYLANPAAAPSNTIVDGESYAASTTTFPAGYSGLLDKSGSTGGPKAYLNYLIFDRDYNFRNGGFVRLSSTQKEDGSNVAHELMAANVTITEPGYVYIYLSNENETPVEVYFDDFTVTQTKSPVIQIDDFDPFGLTTGHAQRELSTQNNFLFNGGSELNAQTGLYETDFRNYDPALGRFTGVDKNADAMKNWTPYQFAFNNPVMFNDPTGLQPKPEKLDSDGPNSGHAGGSGGGGAYLLSSVDDPYQWAENRWNEKVEEENKDNDLMARTRAGDEDAIAEYVRKNGGLMISFGGLTNGGGPDLSEQLADMVNFYFCREFNNVKLPIDWTITSKLENQDGITRRVNGRISISISEKVFSDPRRLYITLGHELIHASDLNPGGYADYLLKFMEGTPEEIREQYHAAMEYHAYSWSVPMSKILMGTSNGEAYLANCENTLSFYGLYNLANEYLSK